MSYLPAAVDGVTLIALCALAVGVGCAWIWWRWKNSNLSDDLKE